MVGGHRHHVQCNYCHRKMIGGVTRFKKHLAGKRGEIKGCDAVPNEVREIIRKHLAAAKPRKTSSRKKAKVHMEPMNMSTFDGKDTESDESDREMAAARLESLRILHEECKSDNQQLIAGSREFFDAFSNVPCKDEQGLAPSRATDLGWAHGMMVNGDRQKIKCKYCHRVILGGGISRLKQHLAGERGNIAPCEEVPEDVKGLMQQHLGFKVLERLKRQKESEDGKGLFHEGEDANTDDMQRRANADLASNINGKRRRKAMDDGSSSRRRRSRKSFIATAPPIHQPMMHLAFASQESMDQADIAVAKFMYDAGIPFNAANSSYFQLMADAIAAVGPGYKMPSYHALRGKLLNKSVHEAADLCQELRKSWEVTGCSVMADRWADETDRTVINFFVYCPKGTMFLKSVDASKIYRMPEALADLFDTIIQEVGPKNIVHVITDCSETSEIVGKILRKKYGTFFWSACAAQCIDLMLENLAKMDEVKEVLAKAKRISQLIYNHAWVLNLMRKKTGGRDIVQPAVTKFARNFLTLQSIMSLKEALHQMFTSNIWVQSTLSRERAGEEVTEIVLDPLFWSSIAKVLKVSKPLITVLHIADSEERPSMGFIYDAMEKAKRSIVAAFNKESDYRAYLEVINHIWEEKIHSPLHAAAYYLNPAIFYNLSFSNNKRIHKGLLDCIETLEPSLNCQDTITQHKTYYEEAVGDFSRPVAIRGRESLSPATWWSLYASDYPELQRFAIRILSQTCSGIRCERNWSMFERIHASKRNRLEQKRLNDLLFIHYNLRLQQRQTGTLGSKILMSGAHDPTCLEGMNADAGDWVEDLGALEGEGTDWMDGSPFIDFAVASAKISNVNNHNDSIDDGCSDDSNENNGSEDS
eukprot:TRINITY_DN6137_c0_g3_i1.p1 TRINITY_DN6137_c0_g3~~TRINITY_DN6137_c0_g3_i1.p1  ORF type:complete len:950 (-),score=168.42 TRINITY_DN6137_c0_g3_i1:785-3400(-)